MDLLLGVVYVAGKFVAYAIWCYVGLRLFRDSASFKAAVGFGFVRLVIGICFGIAVFIVGGMLHLDVPGSPWKMYFWIYAPVRWIEWSNMVLMIVPAASATNFLFGPDAKARLWVLGGIVVSFAADIPNILANGAREYLPVGRFLC